MNRTKNEINSYLHSKNWTGYGILNQYERNGWNACESDKEAYEWFLKKRDADFGIERAVFQSSHSAMSARGAAAYANNWN